MSEFAAVAGLVAGTGALIAAGVSVGTHYIESVFRLNDQATAGAREPLVLPSHPSGSNKQMNNNA